MSRFGLSDDQLFLIKKLIQNEFGAETDLKVYIFGSRVKGKQRKYSDIDLAFLSKDKNLNKKISKLNNAIEESRLPYKVDLVNFSELLPEYLPEINKSKKVFWTQKEALRMTPWRICPLGHHWVSKHLKSGNSDLTDGHCRKNPKGKDILKYEEMKKISESHLFTSPKVKASIKSMGFGKKENKYDVFINGWCAYWNDLLRPKELIHPNLVKALLASESSFVENPKRTSTHTAIGISQIMPRTLTLLSSRSKELRNHHLEISKEEALDPNINISIAIRWLFRKYEIVKSKKKDASWIDAVEEYKGIRNQKGPVSDKVRKNFKKYFDTLSSNSSS